MKHLLGQWLMSETRPNHEKLLYNALVKFREEQLENYQGVPLEHSASDYHHVAKPASIPPSRPGSSQQNRSHYRRRSQFSILSEESGAREGYYKDPVTATSTTTKESYDPYRSSRTPIIRSSANHDTVVRMQGSGASHARNASHAASLRHPAASGRFQPQLHASHVVLFREGAKAGQHRRPSSATAQSRCSLASSRRSEVGIRKSVSHKRQVSFQHSRQRSSSICSRAKEPIRPTSSDTESCKGNQAERELLVCQSSPSLPTPPPVRRPRKPASDLEIKKSRAVSHYWKDEARKVSSELGKICEEAFNRSSVASDKIDQGTNGQAIYAPVRKDDAAIALSNQLKIRPLPQPPAESMGSITLRELAETRKRLLEHCQNAGSDCVPSYLTDVIAHLDRLMDPTPRSDKGEVRSASDPNPTSTKSSSLLPPINEESLLTSGPYETSSSRSTSDPLKSAKQVSFTDASQTIRLVSPEASSHQQFPPIQPLSIRKKSSTSVNPPGATCPEAQRSTTERTGYDVRLFGGLDTIEEDPRSPKRKDIPESSTGARKWSWFKRQADSVEEAPSAASLTKESLKDDGAAELDVTAGHRSSSSPKMKNESRGNTDDGMATPLVEAKKTWLRKMFSKTNKNSGPALAVHKVIHDGASETNSNTTSTDYLPMESRNHGPKKQNTPNPTEHGPNLPGLVTTNSANSSRGRPVHVNQNWFARFSTSSPRAESSACLSARPKRGGKLCEY